MKKIRVEYALIVSILGFVLLSYITMGCSQGTSSKEDNTNSAISDMKNAIADLSKQQTFNFVTTKSKIGNIPVTTMKLAIHDRFDKAFLKLHQEPEMINKALITWVQDNISTIPSPLIMEMGDRLSQGKPEEGVKWLIIGIVFAQYDLQKCKDRDASGSRLMSYLHQYPKAGEFFRKHPEQKKHCWQGAFQWLDSHNSNSSPLWLCSVGAVNFHFDSNKKLLSFKREDILYPETAWSDLEKRSYLEFKQSIIKQFDSEDNQKSH